MANIAEIAEMQAEGRVAAIYADIREVLGVPFVNLIYRHLATVPDVLDCVWAALQPHYVSGALAEQAVQLRGEVAAMVGQWPVVRVGSTSTETHAAAALVGMYNEANSMNLLALLHLLGPRDAQPGPLAVPAQAAAATGPGAWRGERSAVPRLPQFAELHQREIDRVLRLNGYAETGVPPIVASLYRHLAVWPDVLHKADLVLTPLEELGLLGRGRADTCIAATRCAQARPLAIGPLVDAFHSQFEARLRHFAKVTISKMIPVGAVLSMAFSPAAHSHQEHRCI